MRPLLAVTLTLAAACDNQGEADNAGCDGGGYTGDFEAVVASIDATDLGDCSSAVTVSLDIVDPETGETIETNVYLGQFGTDAVISEQWLAEQGVEVGTIIEATRYEQDWCEGGAIYYEFDLDMSAAEASCMDT